MSYDLQKLNEKRVVYLEGDGDDNGIEPPNPEFTMTIGDLKQICGVTNALGEVVPMTDKEFNEFVSKCPNIKM
jgi:hypothetical protein